VHDLCYVCIDSTVLTSGVPTDGPLLVLMLNILQNLTADGVVSWDSKQIMHYIVEVCPLLLLHRRWWITVLMLLLLLFISSLQFMADWTMIFVVILSGILSIFLQLWCWWLAGDEVCICGEGTAVTESRQGIVDRHFNQVYTACLLLLQTSVLITALT